MNEASRLMELRARVAALLAVLLAVMMIAPAASAQGNDMRLELAAAGAPQAGEQWMLALHFTPRSDEWHGYWKNPGDAGLGMMLKWDLPEGWKAGDPLYPVPKRLIIGGLMNHVYEGEYTVLVPISVPASADPAKAPAIGLTADYLACTDKICVPQHAQLTLDPSLAIGDPRFDAWRAKIAPLLASPGRFAVAGGRLRLAIPLPATAGLNDPHLFIANPDLVDYAAPQDFARKGDWLIGEIPLDGAFDASDVRGILSFGSDGRGVRFVAEPGTVPTNGIPLDPVDEGELPPIWLALLGALAGGLLLNVMPCVFPILSLKALALAKAGGSEAAARRDALAYTAGVVLACLALGGLLLALRAGGEQIGWAFQLQEPGVVVGLLVLTTAITANLAGAFELPGPVLRGDLGGSSFATGLLAAFVATPCTGPFMAAALGAALLLPTLPALLLFAALGLGLALPFLLLGFVPALRARLPKPGSWMERFRKWMALPMGLTALALVWLVWRMGGGAFAFIAVGFAMAATLAVAFALGRPKLVMKRARLLGGLFAFVAVALAWELPGYYEPTATNPSESILHPVPFSAEALAKARASGKPVFLWFTADWCVTCKVNESVAIEREEVREAFARAGVVAMRGDWTLRDAEIASFLAEHDAAGVPLYLWYRAGGEAQKLPQLLSAELLAGLPEAQTNPRSRRDNAG